MSPFQFGQIDEPNEHDLLAIISLIETPLLVIHGVDDPTVSIQSGQAISDAAKNATFVPIEGGDHVFNTPNPFEVDEEPSVQLDRVWNAIKSWLSEK